MKQISEVKYSPETDPSFFVFLDRLEKAALFKETDRINGRVAMDDFITGKDSLRYQKVLKQYERLKNEFLT
jgi:hypothetical protein